ncbi:MAG: YraN family protein [Desulfobulbaceae bacterium]|nr:YraN family protein [Desulfobulbaceae bacterium]HIJ78234.1 YraN family protein [Deltaproteobacteria bacterium]
MFGKPKKVKADNLSVGILGEKLARQHLKKQGYRIIAKNYRTALGEIDIIAEDDKTLVFIEVKTRRDRSCGHPLEAVTPAKCRQISKVALLYLAENKMENREARFDVVAVSLGAGDKPEMEIVQNAFELCYGA